MLRDDIYCDDVGCENIGRPIESDVKRQQKYYPCTRSTLLKSWKLKAIPITLVLSMMLINGYPTEIFEESCPIAMRFFPVPKPPVSNPNLFNDKAYRMAVFYFNKYQQRINNKRYLTVIDYTKPSYTKRMSIIDLQTHRIERHLVAHGKNSGNFYAIDFSNRLNSYKSCKGVFVTGNTYWGSHGKSLPLMGLQRGVNDNALERGIVIHGADYVSTRSVGLNGGFLGRSWGCPAVPLTEVEQIVEKIRNGSLLYIHGTS
jgi:hypothetical protein